MKNSFSACLVGANSYSFSSIRLRVLGPGPAAAADLGDVEEFINGPAKAAVQLRIVVGRVLRRYSLDELPQLFNVLRGEMSIVGPRPELDSVVEHYPTALHQRHYVKPGLTGLWQVSARGSGPMHENGQWDLVYVDRVSLRTDLQILAKTPRALVGDNAGS